MDRIAAFLAVALLVGVAPPATADPPEPFLERARSYHPEDGARLPALRAELAQEVPDLFFTPLPPCPLRSALAKALSPEEARALLEGAGPEPETLAVVVENLAGRHDLADLVLATRAYARLEATDPRLLAQIAANALLDGDPRLVRRLLEGPAFERAADMLSSLPHPEGLRTLADVVTGAFPISGSARARLGNFEPDFWNGRYIRPLERERVERLVATATADPDPALRTLAARILLRADDPAFAAQTVQAYVGSRSAHAEDQDWHELGKLAEAPVSDPRIAIEDRLDMLEGWLIWTWVRGEEDPAGAEAMAAALRPVLAAAEPRFRGEAILVLVDYDTLFVTTTLGRKRAAPSFLAILDDLEKGRPDDAPALAALGREAAARLRAVFAEEEGYPKVRIEDRPLAAEAAWRPAPREIDTALAGVFAGIDDIERYEAALARVADANLPPAARRELFEDLLRVAHDGMPPSAWVEEDPTWSFDPNYVDALFRWMESQAATLDGGLAEIALRAFVEGVPEDRVEAAWRVFDRVVALMDAGGPRTRLEAHAAGREGAR